MPAWLINLLIAILLKASPEIKGTICEKLNELEAKAAQTKNPFDDILVKMAKGMAGCDRE